MLFQRIVTLLSLTTLSSLCLWSQDPLFAQVAPLTTQVELQMGPNQTQTGLTGSLKILGEGAQQILWNLQRDQALEQYSMQLDIRDPASASQSFKAILNLGGLLQNESSTSSLSLSPKHSAEPKESRSFNLNWPAESSAQRVTQPNSLEQRQEKARESVL